MNLLVDAAAGWTAGGATRVRELARTLPALRPDNRYLFAVRRNLAGTVERIAPTVRVVSPPPILERSVARLVWERLALPHTSRRFRPDVVFSPFNVIPVRWPGRPRLALIVSNLAPYSTTILGASPLSFRLRMAALRRLTDRSIARADRVFLLSAQALDLIVEPSLPSKAEIIPMAPPSVPADLSAKRPNIRQPYFLVVSDLLRFKGIEQVVRALALLAPRSRPLVLVCGRFIDRQYARQLQEESRARGLQESFRLVGPVDHDRLLSLMAGCRGCVVPSRFENSSRIPAEAMATGAPVIASDIVPLREACADAALYFPLDDVDTLRAHLERLVGDDLFRLDLRRKGAARIRGMSSTDASARILTSLEHLLDL